MTYVDIYARQSSTKQSSIEEQLQKIKTYCEINHMTVSHIYVDKCSAWSNNSSKRPAFKRLMKNLYPNNNIIIYDVSRFSRDLAFSLKCLKQLSNKNIKVYSISDNSKWTSNKEDQDDFLFKLLESQKFSNQLSKRLIAKNIWLRSNGNRFGNPPFGKKVVKFNGIRGFVPNNDEISLINNIKSLYLFRNNFPELKYHAIERICQLLNSSKIYKRGKLWTKYSLRRVIKSCDNSSTTKLKALDFYKVISMGSLDDGMSCIDLDGSDDDIEEKVYFVECSDCKKYIEVDKNTRDIFSSNINFYCYNLPDRRCGE